MANNRIRELIDIEIDRRGTVEVPSERWCVPVPKFSKSDGPRRYFGGSQVGGDCDRQRWYGFHWATAGKKFEPRILRLFNRGHLEEARFITWLRMINIEVEEYDPSTIPMLFYHAESDCYYIKFPGTVTESDYTLADDVSGTYHEWIARSRGLEIPEPQQFSWECFNGHHKGNTDGQLRYVPDQDKWGVSLDEWILAEFKTHNDKSFAAVEAAGVYQGKNEHWHQMQRYMGRLQYRLGLYGAVNKNTDQLYFEFVPFEPTTNEIHDSRAYTAIYDELAPRRISNSASYYVCRWCDFRPQCHFGAPLARNCRTCVSSIPVANGDWGCRRWQKKIPRDVEAVGCDFYKMRTD